MEKICKLCGVSKDISQFHKDRKMLYGVGNRCKTCRKLQSVDQYKNNSKEYHIYHRAKSRASKKKWEFNIELSDIVIPEYCPILETKIDIPSIDRIDSNKGYIKGNIQIVSNRANMLKNNATIEELELILKFLKNNYDKYRSEV